MNAAERKQYYDFEKYMRHINGCTGVGDQFCKCGMASVMFNLGELLLDGFPQQQGVDHG